MVTFGDMMSLLLTFFVLLLSFAEMDVQKFKEMSGKLEEAFGVQRKEPVEDLPKGMDIISRDFNPQFSVDVLLKKIKSAMKSVEKGKIEILQDMRGVVLRITDESFFDRGRAKLKPSAWPILDSIVSVARSVKNDISIESHTDDIEHKVQRYRDSWALSAARTIETARYFERFGNIKGDRLHPVAKGDGTPLVENADDKSRRTNRRIEIVFTRSLDTENQIINRMFSPTERAIKRRKRFPIDIFNLGN